MPVASPRRHRLRAAPPSSGRTTGGSPDGRWRCSHRCGAAPRTNPPSCTSRGPTVGCEGDAALHARRRSATYPLVIIFSGRVSTCLWGWTAGGCWWRSTASPCFWCCRAWISTSLTGLTQRQEKIASSHLEARSRFARHRWFWPAVPAIVLSDPPQVHGRSWDVQVLATSWCDGERPPVTTSRSRVDRCDSGWTSPSPQSSPPVMRPVDQDT